MATSAVFTDLPAGASFMLSVAAVALNWTNTPGYACSTRSSEAVLVTLPEATPTAPPTVASMVVTAFSIVVSVVPPSVLTRGGVIRSYAAMLVDVLRNTIRYIMVTATPGSGSEPTMMTFTGLYASASYQLSIRAVNSVGQSPPFNFTLVTRESSELISL